jgi:uncharacterized RDD family membrane protein YckC
MSDMPPPPPPPSGGMQPPAGGAGAPGVPGPLASWGQRVVAWLITWAISVVITIVLFIIAGIFGAISDVLGALFFGLAYLAGIALWLYFGYLDGATGGHPGKRIMGLKTVSISTGDLIGGGMGIARQLAHFVDAIICYIGYLFPLWDEKRQTIADKIVSTVVLCDQPKMDVGPDVLKP